MLFRHKMSSKSFLDKNEDEDEEDEEELRTCLLNGLFAFVLAHSSYPNCFLMQIKQKTFVSAKL